MGSLSVSAVIPTFNRARLLARALSSCLAALAPSDEIVVADDGSEDATAEVVAAAGPRVKHLRLPHRGAGAARNAGYEAAKGPLVAFLDSDDEWFPDKIALQRAFLERRPDVLFTFSDFGVRLEDGTEERRYLPHWQQRPRPLSEVLREEVRYSSVAPLPPGRDDFSVHVGSLYAAELHDNVVSAFTVMLRKDVAGDVVRFADDLPTCEEWQAFARLAKKGPAAYFDTETAWQHGHSGPRLTRFPAHVWASARIATIERVWGSDPEFLRDHADEVRSAVADAQLMRARWFLRHGDATLAREALRAAGGGPLSHRVLSWLPGPVCRGLLRAVRGPADRPAA
jgi:glycosyltransferase involved in cell wall biosynthesis